MAVSALTVALFMLGKSCFLSISVNLPPVVSGCPTDRSVVTNTFQGFAAATWTIPTATDDDPVAVTSTHNPNDQFPVGSTLVTYTFTDTINQQATCSFFVNVTFGKCEQIQMNIIYPWHIFL